MSAVQPSASAGVLSERVYSIKFITIGKQKAGKTSLIERFAKGVFSTSYRATIGVDLFQQELPLEHDQRTADSPPASSSASTAASTAVAAAAETAASTSSASGSAPACKLTSCSSSSSAAAAAAVAAASQSVGAAHAGRAALSIWDCAGQERYPTSMPKMFWRETLGVVIAIDGAQLVGPGEVDVTSMLEPWVSLLVARLDLMGADVPVLVVVTKSDLLSAARMREIAPHLTAAVDSVLPSLDASASVPAGAPRLRRCAPAWIETSARDNKRVDEAFRVLLRHVDRAVLESRWHESENDSALQLSSRSNTARGRNGGGSGGMCCFGSKR